MFFDSLDCLVVRLSRARLVVTCFCLVSAQLVLAPATMRAAEDADGARFVVDAENSSVTFELGAFLHTVKGSFVVQETEVVVRAAERRISGEIVLDARSGDTGNKRRDRIMHSEILLSQEHPTIRLVPSSWTGELDLAGGGTPELDAQITLVGKTHQVQVPLEVEALEDGQLRVRGELEVPFVAWGLKDPSKPLLRVEKRVQILVDLLLERR